MILLLKLISPAFLLRAAHPKAHRGRPSRVVHPIATKWHAVKGKPFAAFSFCGDLSGRTQPARCVFSRISEDNAAFPPKTDLGMLSAFEQVLRGYSGWPHQEKEE